MFYQIVDSMFQAYQKRSCCSLTSTAGVSWKTWLPDASLDGTKVDLQKGSSFTIIKISASLVKPAVTYRPRRVDQNENSNRHHDHLSRIHCKWFEWFGTLSWRARWKWRDSRLVSRISRTFGAGETRCGTRWVWKYNHLLVVFNVHASLKFSIQKFFYF